MRRDSETMGDAIVGALLDLPDDMRKSIALDNGGENAQYRYVSKRLHATIYFCDPYKSWQKGGVENMNRLIRRVYPKGTDFSQVRPEDVRCGVHCAYTLSPSRQNLSRSPIGLSGEQAKQL